MLDLLAEPINHQLDAQLGVLILLLGLVLAACLLPVPRAPKTPTPTDDTTKTRRLK